MHAEGRAPRIDSARWADRRGAAWRWLGPLGLALAFAALAAWSWDRWSDVQIDFGNELYVAWRLASGDHLYRDLAYRNGPLSPYMNAGWFQLFGVSVRTLVACNLAILAATCALVWRVFAPACGRGAAFACGLVLLAAFGFAHTLVVGNYNWVTPYQHAQTHGVALGIAAALALGLALGRRSDAAWLVAGACVGGVFLTKAELFAPVAAAAAVGVGLEAGARDRRPARAALLLGIGALVPVAIAFVALASRIGSRVAFEGVLGNWRHLGGILADPFYVSRAGLETPWHNAARALAGLAALAAFASVGWLADRALPLRGRALVAPAAAAALAIALLAARHRIAWDDLARALPLTSAIGAALLLAACWRRRDERAELARLAPLALFAVLGLGLLAKIALHARVGHYGFALAMPATLVLVAGLVVFVPRLLPVGRGSIARALGAGAVAAFVVLMLAQSSVRYARKQVAVGGGADRILAEPPRATRIAEALARLERRLPVGATLLVLPEGAGLNYWLRRRNPSRYLLFLPTEIAAFGEAPMLADLRSNPPDYVVLAHRDGAEFGVGPFGRDPRNGEALRAWVEGAYERVERIGPEPFGPDGFGLVILRRRA